MYVWVYTTQPIRGERERERERGRERRIFVCVCGGVWHLHTNSQIFTHSTIHWDSELERQREESGEWRIGRYKEYLQGILQGWQGKKCRQHSKMRQDLLESIWLCVYQFKSNYVLRSSPALFIRLRKGFLQQCRKNKLLCLKRWSFGL